eukprot:gnl/TRDRNA2_/TRDRNA2_163964_c0_seq2.p1 gnl/TRDRNA2_/TRDRNA2_163964_c0~~gnl/TRDRNA2_/TRDRNA2_163964_c0_seq2.p1  ORF type:complete len:480 (+),score=93.63 gnl/TRDRNA2_/TRDRNA2_163964_c0_seq2:52-1491(+)
MAPAEAERCRSAPVNSRAARHDVAADAEMEEPKPVKACRHSRFHMTCAGCQQRFGWAELEGERGGVRPLLPIAQKAEKASRTPAPGDQASAAQKVKREADVVKVKRELVDGWSTEVAQMQKKVAAVKVKRELVDEEINQPSQRDPAEASPCKRSRVAQESLDSSRTPVCGTLCLSMPAWISRRGRWLHVDLGGRRARDQAAMVLAEVVRAALSRLIEGSDGLLVSLQLTGNQLHREGLEALLEATSRGCLNGRARVADLAVERNKLDGRAATLLAAWCARQPGGPPDELHLSQNKIGDEGAHALLSGLSRCATASALPIWVELSRNRIRQAGKLLDSLSTEMPLCLAADRSACGPSMCASCCSGAPAGKKPRLHLPGIMEQHGESEETILVAPPAQHAEAPAAAPKLSDGYAAAAAAEAAESARLAAIAQDASCSRHLWAQSLGSKYLQPSPSLSSVADVAEPPPSCGLFDLVRRPQKA